MPTKSGVTIEYVQAPSLSQALLSAAAAVALAIIANVLNGTF